MDAGEGGTHSGHQSSLEDATGRILLPTLYLSPFWLGQGYHIPDPALTGPNGYLMTV